MPILDIQIIGSLPHAVHQGLAERLAEAACEVLQSHPRGTWVKLTMIPREHYAESGGGPEDGVLPVFVAVQRRDVPTGDALASEIRKLTETIAAICERPGDNVHVMYEPSARGRLAFGGKLVE